MSHIKETLNVLAQDAVTVVQQASYHLRSKMGEVGGLLADALERELTSSGATEAKRVLEVASQSADHVLLPVLDWATTLLDGEDQKVLSSRLACRIQGLNPDAPLHAAVSTTQPPTQ